MSRECVFEPDSPVDEQRGKLDVELFLAGIILVGCQLVLVGMGGDEGVHELDLLSLVDLVLRLLQTGEQCVK